MTKIYLLSKKIHRLLVIILTSITLVMAGTGLMLEEREVWFGLDLGMMRFIHNKLSVPFTIVLSLMILSGLFMYFYPFYVRRKHENTGSFLSE